MIICDFCRKELLSGNNFIEWFANRKYICSKGLFGGYNEHYDICNECINKIKKVIRGKTK